MAHIISDLRVKYLDWNIRFTLIRFYIKILELIFRPIIIIINFFGFEVIEPKSGIQRTLKNLEQYPNRLEYDKYIKVQRKTNEKKRDRVFAKEENLIFISNVLKGYMKDRPLKMLCHGTRNGYEQNTFINYLPAGSSAIGTEISESSLTYLNTINWDFNVANDQWIETFDVIYSNSHDNAFNLKVTLGNWLETLRIGGLLVIEHSIAHEFKSKSDPSQFKLELFPFLILEWFNGKAICIDILDAPKAFIQHERHKIFFIQKMK